MENSVKKIMLIGWDGASPKIIEGMMKKGLLKNFARLKKEGTFINALNPYPTLTAQNWTTISTGAWPGRHGVTGYNVHHPGDPLDKIYTGFNTFECSAEHIWDTAEKVGKNCILVNYETSWPPTIQKGIVVHGCGPNYQDEFHKITPDIIFSNERYPGIILSDLVSINRSNGKNSAKLKFKTNQKEEKIYYAEWDDTDRKITIFKDKNKKNALATISEGAWSDPVCDNFLYEDKKTEAAFRFKLIKLPSLDDDEFKLVITSLIPSNKFAFPSELGPELNRKLGPFYPRGGWELGFSVEPETYLEMLEYYQDWLTGACEYLLNNNQWDLLYTMTHNQDYISHLFMRCYDPITTKDSSSQKKCEDYMEKAFEMADRSLGRIIEYADDDTLIVVVSDHGATTWLEDINIRNILIEKGLMRVDPDNGQVIWSKTKAVPQRACYIYVNLKGRDPQGIVEPGAEYEKVREQIIEALHDYKVPETKKRAFSLVLKSEDARMLGLHGPRIGDIVYALYPEYGHEHGQNLPTGQLGKSSLESIILLSGPGIKKGFDHKGMTGIQDIVPTLCYMTDIPIPNGCEGAIIYDALEDPNMKMKKIKKLEKELERWKTAYEKKVSITHSRF